jgi:antitoxin ParD1/3/4
MTPSKRQHITKAAITQSKRHEQKRRAGVRNLRQALIDGEKSGEPQPFDFATFKQRKTAQYS